MGEITIDENAETLLRGLVQTLDDMKAEELKVLDLRGKSPVTDFIILATGTSDPHLRALRDALDTYLKTHKVGVIGAEKDTGTGWLVVDAFDVMIHLQTEAMREFYALDFLWKDATEVSSHFGAVRA